MDIEQIKMLTDLMVENDLTEVMIRDGETRVVIRRGPPVGAAVHAPSVPQAISPLPRSSAQAASVTADPGDGAPVIRSPMVGTFYTAPDSESPPFVAPGSRVGPETVVCLIEAMKVYNEIKAEIAGTIEAVLVGTGQPVEYGQPLFRVLPG